MSGEGDRDGLISGRAGLSLGLLGSISCGPSVSFVGWARLKVSNSTCKQVEVVNMRVYVCISTFTSFCRSTRVVGTASGDAVISALNSYRVKSTTHCDASAIRCWREETAAMIVYSPPHYSS